MEPISALLNLALTFNTVGGVIIGLLGFIVAFGLAVFIHELGHFLAAKAFKVPVERFVIGFDKEAMPFLPGCIWERRIGETVYGISLIPLGGYVKMSGVVHPDIEKYLDGNASEEKPLKSSEVRLDGPAPAAAEPLDKNTLQGQAMQDMAALYRKPFWQKTIIYGAGVVMNLLLAMVVMTLLFAKGHDVDAPLKPVVGWFPEDSPLRETPLQTGDVIVAANGTSIENYTDLQTQLIAFMGEREVTEVLTESFPLAIQRPAAERYEYSIPMTLVLSEEGRLTRHFGEAIPRSDAYVEYVAPNDPADKAGISHGDLVLSIDGTPVQDWTHFRYLVLPSPGKELTFVVLRDGKELSMTVTPMENPDNRGTGLVGIINGNAEKLTNQEPILTAMMKAPGRVKNATVNYLSNLRSLGGKVVEGNFASVQRQLSGPAGIAQVAYRQAQRGFDDWLRFLIVLNVALAVMNILPFPVLDGGHICFALYEALFKQPVPPRVLVPLLNSAVIFILIFFVLVTFNDLFRIFA